MLQFDRKETSLFSENWKQFERGITGSSVMYTYPTVHLRLASSAGEFGSKELL